MEMSEIADVHKIMKDKRSWTGGPLMMNSKDYMQKVCVPLLSFNSG